MKCIALVLGLAALIPALLADGIPVGTWVRRATPDGMVATLIVEAAGAGQKFTFKVKVASGAFSTMIVTTLGDGKDAMVYVDGKASGETMAIRMIDARHMTNVLKMQGSTVTQTSEISADGKVIKTVTPGGAAGQAVEYWDKK